jgi:hypothetical protein
MSARKLGRLAGLVFVLAAIFGGAATGVVAEHAAGGNTAIVQPTNLIIDWD